MNPREARAIPPSAHMPQAKVKDLEGQVQVLQDSLQTMRLERTRQAGELETLKQLLGR